ncbi:MAG: hypothetical protein N2C14_02920 [Planctomycetales bacterium]
MTPLDTTDEAARIQLEIQRRLGPAGRFQLAMEMCDAARSLMEAGLQRRNPNFSPDEIRRELIRILYGIPQAK